MFDLGWQEFLMVAIVLMLVVGPKDMPRILRTFSQFMRKARYMANEFTSSLDDVARQNEMQDVKKMLEDARKGELEGVADMIGGDVKDIAGDLKAATGADQIEADLKSVSDASASSSVKSAPKKPAPKRSATKKGAPKKKAAKKKAAKTKSAKSA